VVYHYGHTLSEGDLLDVSPGEPLELLQQVRKVCVKRSLFE
jgi:hypothetical protein